MAVARHLPRGRHQAGDRHLKSNKIWDNLALRGLRRQGWRVVNHFQLRAWDIDHVLVGPGGAFAIETKWSAKPWTLEPGDPRLHKAIEQARSNARSLRLWADFRAVGIVDVHPVVVVWGASECPIAKVDGISVVPGALVGEWRAGLPNDVLSPAEVDAASHALNRHVTRRDRHVSSV